jgi:signal transduction histidine kinase
MRLNSLALRLFFSATTWTVVILVVTGVVLSSIYRTAVEHAFDRRLGVYLRSLVADVATPEENAGKSPQPVGEPLFDLPLSGWYWQVTRLDAPTRDVRSSRSLWDATLPQLGDPNAAAAPGGTRQGYAEGPEGQRLRIVEQTIDLGEEGRYLVAVAGDPAEVDEEIHSFDSALVLTFGVLAIVLLLTTTFQVRFGLAPLKRISEGLAAIRSGAAERLEGAFPVEIAPLARETNALIEANREIVDRARTHVGNLAHALKTPISVMLNEATSHGDNPLARKVCEQTEIMRDQVTRHLERARLAARVAAIGTVTEVRPVITALARTMEKIHHHRGIAIDVDAPDSARFRGEQQDLEEMVGNLVDNACKWAQSRVAVEAVSEKTDPRDDCRRLRIVVDDDGPGLSPQEREQVARRGRRLDETKPGSGLGLSIVVELANLYGGGLTLGTAPIGGLRAELVLPGA